MFALSPPAPCAPALSWLRAGETSAGAGGGGSVGPLRMVVVAGPAAGCPLVPPVPLVPLSSVLALL